MNNQEYTEIRITSSAPSQDKVNDIIKLVGGEPEVVEIFLYKDLEPLVSIILVGDRNSAASIRMKKIILGSGGVFGRLGVIFIELKTITKV